MLIETFEDAAAFALSYIFSGQETFATDDDSLRDLYDSGRYTMLAWKARSCLAERWDPNAFHGLLCRKHHDYGPENINKFGKDGLKVRLWDKVARYENLCQRMLNALDWDVTPLVESLEDTLLDIIGYVTIYVMLDFRVFDAPLKGDLMTEDEKREPVADMRTSTSGMTTSISVRGDANWEVEGQQWWEN